MFPLVSTSRLDRDIKHTVPVDFIVSICQGLKASVKHDRERIARSESESQT